MTILLNVDRDPLPTAQSQLDHWASIDELLQNTQFSLLETVVLRFRFHVTVARTINGARESELLIGKLPFLEASGKLTVKFEH